MLNFHGIIALAGEFHEGRWTGRARAADPAYAAEICSLGEVAAEYVLNMFKCANFWLAHLNIWHT